MHRISTLFTALALTAAGGCAARAHDGVAPRAMSDHAMGNRPGIAVVASGGIAGWEHVTLLDSATARYVTVTRRACPSCMPLDSASGTLAADDVARIYEIADSERVLLARTKAVACADCDEQALVTTAVFGNRRRTVIRSGSEASPEVLGRVHVALAEAIRASRASSGGDTTPPND